MLANMGIRDILSLFGVLILIGIFRGNNADSAADQLVEYAKAHPNRSEVMSDSGAPVDGLTASITVGQYGPILLRDSTFLNTMARFGRERIPERVAHAKGVGGKGYFEVTNDVTMYTKAALFSKIGKRTPIRVRFSRGGSEHGAADTMIDVRGFAIKFDTEDGIFDLVGSNAPMFFLHDPMMFPHFYHSQKRNPITNLHNPNSQWDFLTSRTETTFLVMRLASDLGIPLSYRFMDGYGSHTFKLVNSKNEMVYCKFHFKTNQGVKHMLAEEAKKIAGEDPDYMVRDLYNAIHDGHYPSWTFCIQVMTVEQAKKFRWSIFDLTKIWPEAEYPLIPVGKFTLNENPKNHFAEVEQIAFSPDRMVPGIEPSEDRILQGRMFVYSDAQRYRLGPNHLQLPVNCPYASKITNYERDGLDVYYNQDGAPNYSPNSFSGPIPSARGKTTPYDVSGVVDRYDVDQDDFSQPAMFWNGLKDDEKDRLVSNLIETLKDAADFIQERAVKNFEKVSTDFGKRVENVLKRHSKTAGNKSS